jgi:hypothetical protein
LMKWQVLFNSRNNLIGRSRRFMRYSNTCNVLFEEVRCQYVIDCGLNDQDSIPGKGSDFSLCQQIQTGSETHTTSYWVGASSSLSWDEETGVELATHLCLVLRSLSSWYLLLLVLLSGDISLCRCAV